MNTPRTDEKDNSLTGNFAMCYGIMVEFARQLERELASSESIRQAEKKILIQEIESHTATKAELEKMRFALETAKHNTAIGPYDTPASGYGEGREQ